MAFGLPSAEEIRDYLISQGKDPAEAAKLANVAARQNAAQAARTSALSVLAGAAPARAAGTAAIEAAPAAGRAAMSVAERVAAAPRNIWEYLTVPQGVVRNPTTGARIPGRHPAGTLSESGKPIGGQTFRQPDYFLPGQNLAQGAAGAGALGAGAAGVSALMDRPAASPMPVMPMDGSISGEEGGGTSYQRALMDSSISGEEGGGTSYLADAQAAGERAPLPMRRPTEAALQVARERVAPPMPQRRPEGLGEQPGGLAGLFNRPVSTKDLYQQSQDNPDDAGAYMRAERQFAKMHPDERSFDLTKLNDQGMAAGGAAKGKPEKDAALHKALDIIAHMLGRH
jgi:hypothetical protein